MVKKTNNEEEMREKIETYWRQYIRLKNSGEKVSIDEFVKLAGVSKPTFYKYKPKDIGEEGDDEVDEVEEKAEEKSEREITKKIVEDVSKKATVEHARLLKVGKYVCDKYEDLAKGYGLSIEEFIDGAVTFWDIYKDKIKELEEDNRKMEAYLNKIMSLISRESIAERVINNAVAMAIAMDVEIKVDELKKVIKLIYEEMA